MGEINLKTKTIRSIGVILLAALISGCSGYSKQMSDSITSARTGNLPQALSSLESNNTGSDKDLLYFMEKGELLRMSGRNDDGRTAWLEADAKVRSWEDDARNDPEKLMGEIGSFLVNDTTRRYDGRDYEKVLLSVRLAQSHLALGDWESARTEIKKMHEREAIIADFRAKEIEKAQEKSREKGIRTSSFRQINGYPIETLDDPSVRALKNSYESAYANYLAGFLYEALGEGSLAAPGYRKAAEMCPGQPLLETSLAELDGHITHHGIPGKTDTLFVIETGLAPTIQSITLPILLPIPQKNGFNILATPISWPVIRADPNTPRLTSLTVDGQSLPVVPLSDVNAMARRALSDEMPGIIARSAVRAITRGAAQAAMDTTASNTSGNAALILTLISVATKVASVATEVADERIWRTLPATFSVTRVALPAGPHQITLATPFGPVTRDITVAGRYSVIGLRMLDQSLYVTQPAQVPKELAPLEVVAKPAESVQPAPIVAPTSPPAPVKKRKSRATKANN